MVASRLPVAVVVAALTASACRPVPAKPSLALTPCRLDGAPPGAMCGRLDVWEDRAAKSGRRLALKVVVFPALARDPAPDPLFLIAGGPGQAITRTASVVAAFDRVRRQRDVVLVDRRGTGGSGALDCRLADEGASLAQRLDETGYPLERLRDCLAGYDADPRLYTTPLATADLDDVRRALGYERINLWGISYGTRAALVYMRDFGPHVRTAVLDGVAPYTNRLPLYFARDAQRALGLVFARCAGDPVCAAAYPGLEPRFGKLLARLDHAPARITVADPLSGAPAAIVLRRSDFTSGLRAILYSAENAALLPLVIDRADRGDFAPFLAQLAAFHADVERSMSYGLLFSVLCTEDAPFIAPAELERESAGTFLGPGAAREMLQVCEAWPRGALPAEYREPIRSDVPTLLLAGELDPVTPRAWAEDAQRGLPHARLLEVPGVGHGATWHGCLPDVVARFIARGAVEGLDATCVAGIPAPPFFVSYAGPEA
jgi:pimeloyl-ACP methyl ester carboxylesterase